jgi:hypothetical protein
VTATGEPSLHAFLLEGLDVRSRDDGSVHNIKDPNGKTVAEVGVGKDVTRLNFITPLAVPVPDGVILSGRDQRFPGRGLVITPENVSNARELLFRHAGLGEPSGSTTDPELLEDSDDAVREHLESVFGTSAFRVIGDAIELDLSVVGETGRQRFISPTAWVVRDSLDGLDTHAVGRGEPTALCGVSLAELAPETTDSSLGVVSCPRCRVRLMAAEIAALPGAGPPAQGDDLGQPKLHDEIARILRNERNRWMTTHEIASEVNTARRYRTRKKTDVTAFQIHGRTRNYAKLFERDGSRVRLLTVAKDRDTTRIGYRNRNEQAVIAATALPGSDHLQKVYVLRCGRCGTEYGANGSGVFQRKCPTCQGGAPGSQYG